MSWSWVAPLALAALAAGVLARVARSVEQERQKVALSRLRLVELRSEPHRSRRQPPQ
ncbi:MAG: hypothetical protein M1435_01070 [Actinobacteria bacterium]|nr:hypothetical protein [Actinomycetota bacterium]